MLKRIKSLDVSPIIINFVIFVIAFFIFCLRSPFDFATSYMWAEDGVRLLDDTEFYGIKSLFIVSNGTLWMFQRLVAWICHLFLYPFNSIRAFPIILSIATKAIEVASVCYFISDKFSWFIREKWVRGVIATTVLLAIPDTSNDLVNCDTSLPFVCIFAVFLIGLNAFNIKREKELSVLETAFLVLMALSSAAAPFMLGVGVLFFLSYLWINRNNVDRNEIIKYIIKLTIILIAVCIQVYMILSNGRTEGIELELLNRVLSNTYFFVWFPYCNYNGVYLLVMLIGLLIWVLIIFALRTDILPVIYGVGFSWFYLLMCSLMTASDYFYNNLYGVSGVGRFISLPNQIAAFYVGWAVYSLWKSSKIRFMSVVIIVLEGYVLFSHYYINQMGNEQQIIDCFNNNVSLYDKEGEQKLNVMCAPDYPYYALIPVSISKSSSQKEGEFYLLENSSSEESSKMCVDTKIVNESNELVKEIYISNHNKDEYFGSLIFDKQRLDMGEEIDAHFEVMSNENSIHDNSYEFCLLLESGKIVYIAP